MENELPDIPEVQEELMDDEQPAPVMPPRVESSMTRSNSVSIRANQVAPDPTTTQ